MFVDDRLQSVIGCQRITSTSSRRPPTTTFFGWFSEEFGGRQIIVDDRRPVGDWLSEQFVGERFSLQHRKPFADQTSWAFTVHRPWIWIKMVWAFSTHIVYFRFVRPQTGGLHSLECATSRALSWPGDVSQPVHACCLCTEPVVLLAKKPALKIAQTLCDTALVIAGSLLVYMSDCKYFYIVGKKMNP